MPELTTVGEHLHYSVQGGTPATFQSGSSNPEIPQTFLILQFCSSREKPKKAGLRRR